MSEWSAIAGGSLQYLYFLAQFDNVEPTFIICILLELL